MEALRIKYSVLLIECRSFADGYVELEIEPNKDRSANLCFVFHDADSKARFLTLPRPRKSLGFLTPNEVFYERKKLTG